MTLDSESKKRLIEQTRMVRTRKRCKPRPGDSDAVSRGEREDVIKQGEQLYRAIFDGSRDAIFITAPDAGFVEVNEAASVLTGYSPEELKNMTIPDLHEEEDMEAYRQFFRRIMAGEQITCEARILRKDGIKVDTEFSNRKIMLGDAVYMHTVARDITERKQAEEALRISEAKYQDLYDQAPDMFVSVDAATGNILDCNQTTATKLGYKKEEIIGRHISEMYHPDSEEDRKKVFKTFAEAGEVHDAELQLKRKDGSRLDVSLNVSAVRDDQGKILYSRSIWRDISMRKQAEAALRQSEEKYHLLVENAPSVLWKTSEKGITVFISSNIEEVYGYTPEEIYADGYNSWFGRIRREDLQEVEKSFQALFGKGKKFDVEYRIKRKDGEWIWVHDAASVVHEENGERYAYGVFTDITERKQVEEELRASEEKYKSIFETAPASLVMVDKNGKIVDINPHHLANIAKGKTPKEYFIGKSIIKHPSIVNAGLSEEYGKVLEGEELDKKDVYFPTLTSGMDGYFNVKGVPVVKADEVIGAVFTHEDITERKRAEDELKSLSSVVEQSTEGMAIADLNGNLIFVNKAWCKMHGYKSYESLVGKNLEIFHNKKQLENDVIPFNEEVKKNGTCTGEVGHITKAGKPFPTFMTTTLLKDAQGNPFAIAGIAKDITDHKQAEDKALEYQMQLKSLALQLSSTEERERHRLATVLHDEVGQSLVLTKLKLDQLRASTPLGTFTETIEEVCNLLGQIIQETRTLTLDLSSPILYELGLEAAVAEWLEDEIHCRHGIETEFHDDQREKPLDDDIRVVLFRNVRELLVNVVKHAQAEKVKVSIHRTDADIHISIEDNGKGFDPIEEAKGAAKRAEFGLFSIRERLEQLGGILDIDSAPGRGSRISMTAPLKKSKTDKVIQTI